MAQRRVLQFDHCDDETRFEIEIVKELNNLKEKNMQNESTLQRISEENISLRHELQNKEEEHKRQLDKTDCIISWDYLSTMYLIEIQYLPQKISPNYL